MPSATYVARRPGPFSSLVQSAEIGGLRLEPHPPARVLDRYYDTDDGELLRRGLALRVREQGGARTVGLRGVEGAVSAPPDAALDADALLDGPLRLPAGPLADALRAAVGDDPLRPLLTVRQYRTPRVLVDQGADVGVVSFDVVVYEAPGARVVADEVEVKPSPGADPLARLGPVFEAHGLERSAHSKVARGVQRMPRTLSEPVLLLPDERRRLEAVAGGDDAELRRRAQVVVLDSRGFRPDTIATQTGLSMARVRHWRQRFREVRLGLLDPEPAPPSRRPAPRPAVPRPAEPSADFGAPVAPPPPEPPVPAPGEGDGLSLEEPPELAHDMSALLDLFSPSATETPLFGMDAEDEAAEARRDAEDEAAEARIAAAPPRVAPPPALPEEPPAEPRAAPPSTPWRNPYPVVLGPVVPDPPPAVDRDVFASVDLRGLLGGAAPVSPPPAAAPEPPAPVPSEALWESPLAARPSPADVPLPRPVLPGDTPLLAAAEATLAYHLALFDARAERFVFTRAPSDARRLLVAAHGLRLAVETFERALPSEAAGRLVAALRPLVADLDAAVQHAQAAAAGGRADLARRAAASVARAADRLDAAALSGWGARAGRLVARLAAQAAEGALRSDDAPVSDDYVGAPGTAPTATRLRHVLGSAVWGRFEALRAFEDDLGAPTDELAAHLAVALSGLHFVLGLTAEAAASPLGEVAEALEAAERAVVRARRGQLAGVVDARALDVLAEVWEEITSPPIRERLAALVASV